MGATATGRTGRLLLTGWSLLLALAVALPLWRPGYVLTYDLVGVADQAFLPASVGIDSALPRSVPLDAVIAVLDSLVPGWALQRLLLLAVVVVAALGAARAVPTRGLAGRAVAATVYAWNPYVAERLVLGHWALLLAYAVLPWILVLSLRAERRDPTPLAGALLLVAVASLTPSGGVLAGAVLLVVLGSRWRAVGGASIGAAAVAVVVLQAPWVVPSLLHPGGGTSDPAAVAAFAAEADTPYGLLASLLTGGGVWNDQVVPVSRGTLLAPALAMVLLLLAAAGLPALLRGWGRAPGVAVLGLGATGLVVAALPSLPGGATLLEWAVVHVPGAGLARDGQKFLAWLLLPSACAAGLGAQGLARRLHGASAVRLAVAVALLLPVVALPDLAGGVWGRLQPVAYPDEWSRMRAVVRDERAGATGDLVVLPFQPYRRFAWNDERVVLDPGPRAMGVPALVPGDLPVAEAVVQGEDRRADAVAAALLSSTPAVGLAEAGVRWVLVERGTPGEVTAAVEQDLVRVAVEGELELLRVDGVVRPWSSLPPAWAVLVADLVALSLVGALLAVVLVGRRRGLGGSALLQFARSSPVT